MDLYGCTVGTECRQSDVRRYVPYILPFRPPSTFDIIMYGDPTSLLSPSTLRWMIRGTGMLVYERSCFIEATSLDTGQPICEYFWILGRLTLFRPVRDAKYKQYGFHPPCRGNAEHCKPPESWLVRSLDMRWKQHIPINYSYYGPF